ncbi:protein TolR [Neiella sp. HB171785]|uniref:Tol-Pal system protein TolR n=2 Tax=Neiella TaxID=1434025 RepID=A0A8J6QPL0_9GAMM|nr:MULTISPECIES: protein TolR [Neiella]MBD1388264.1 protein TolR [Neiella litorisoli]GGA76383.1 protein TolR [Neiella marina]
MSFERKRRRKVADINVVPYIDVMLVLLIIFMVTAPLITQGVKVDLPQGEAEPLSTDTNPPLVASVDADGNYYVSIGDDDDNTPRELDELAEIVAAQLVIAPDTPVVVKGDRRVPYEVVINLMVTLQNHGVPAVGLMTEDTE